MNDHVSSSLKNNVPVDKSMTAHTSHCRTNFEGQLELADTACQKDVVPTTTDSVMATVDISRPVDSNEKKTEPVKFVENDVTSPLSKVCNDCF